MNKTLPALALMTLSITAAQAQNVYYNGRDVDLENRAFMSRGTLMVPAREMGERVGAQFDRDDSNRRMWWTWQGRRATYVKGERNYDLNGRRTSLPTASEARREVLFVPVDLFRGLTDGRVTANRGEWERNGSTIPGKRREEDWTRPGRTDRNDEWNRRNDRNDDWRRRDDRNDDWRRSDEDRRNDGYGRDSIMFERQVLTFSGDERPYKKSGLWMVPFRALADRIGAKTDRTPDGLRAWITLGSDKVQYDKGHTWFRLNGDRREVAVISEERNRILFVPITLFEAVSRGRVRGY